MNNEYWLQRYAYIETLEAREAGKKIRILHRKMYYKKCASLF